MRIAIGQVNQTVGDHAGNVARLVALAARARSAGADLLVVPELAICGYPPMDLLERASFLRDQERALAELAAQARGLAIVTGAVAAAPW